MSMLSVPKFNSFDSLVDDFFASAHRYKGGFNPACDISETPNQYLMNFEMPGVGIKDVKIEISDRKLTVSGKKEEVSSKEDETSVFRERFYGEFTRSFSLPENVASDKIEANYKDGVLSLVLPKMQKEEPKVVHIKDNN